MKKFLFLAAVAALSLATVSCGGEDKTEATGEQTEQTAAPQIELATQNGKTVTIREYTFEVPETFKFTSQTYYYKSNKLSVSLSDDNGNTITAYVDGDARVSDNAESDLADRRKYIGTDYKEIKGAVIDGKSFFVKQYKEMGKTGYARMFKEKSRMSIDMYGSTYAKVGNEFTPEMMEAVCASIK